MPKKLFWNSWNELYTLPRIDVDTFTAGMFYYYECDKAKAGNTPLPEIKIVGGYTTFSINCEDDSPENIISMMRKERLTIYLYEAIKAGYIKNPVNEIKNCEEFCTAFNAYKKLILKQHPHFEFPEPNYIYSEEESQSIINNFLDTREKLEGFINPAEVLQFLVVSELGRDFLPLTLIDYLVKNKMMKSPLHNRSGSKVNQASHTRTKEACTYALNKIIKEKILDLNRDKFCAIASEYLDKGQSLVTTVARAFYKEEVPQEYKAGVGRK